MIRKKMTVLSTAIAAALALGACATDDAPIASMSCTDLAREIGKATQTRDDAAVDSFVGTIDMLVADNKADEIDGGVESIIGDISGAAAQSELGTLNQAFVQKGCT
jgi:hypothetical protein